MTEEEISNRADEIYMAIHGSYDNERDRVIPILKASLREVASFVELRVLKTERGYHGSK